MPPRFKFTREEIINAAVDVASEKGITAVTAKSIAEKLDVSTQPVFTCFTSMVEARKEVYTAAERIFDGYAAEGLSESIPFFGFGKAFLRFVREEPELYKLLFLTVKNEYSLGALYQTERTKKLVCPKVAEFYAMTAEQSEIYFEDMWLVALGIATMYVTDSCPYSEARINDILTQCSIGFCKAIKEIEGFGSDKFDKDKSFSLLVNKK